ncbi:hypothetical protein X975_25135, partial [Stegodyphus mimosarum]
MFYIDRVEFNFGKIVKCYRLKKISQRISNSELKKKKS